MTKKKKILNGIIFLGGLIVFAVYYFQDNEDMEKVEQKHEKEAATVTDSIADVLNASFDDWIEFEENNSNVKEEFIKTLL